MTDAVTTDAAATATTTTTAADTTAASALTAAATLTGGEQTAQTTTTTAAPTLPDGALLMPGADATPEQWGEFYAKLGRPETPEAYELPIPDGDNGEFAKQVAPLLHEAGITAAQAQKLGEQWNALQAANAEAAQAAEATRLAALNTQNQAEATALKSEWGQQHEANMHHAQQAVKQFLPAEHAADIIAAIEAKVGYRATIEMLHGIGKGLAEHDAAGLGSKTDGGARTLASRLYPDLA